MTLGKALKTVLTSLSSSVAGGRRCRPRGVVNRSLRPVGERIRTSELLSSTVNSLGKISQNLAATAVAIGEDPRASAPTLRSLSRQQDPYLRSAVVEGVRDPEYAWASDRQGDERLNIRCVSVPPRKDCGRLPSCASPQGEHCPVDNSSAFGAWTLVKCLSRGSRARLPQQWFLAHSSLGVGPLGPGQLWRKAAVRRSLRRGEVTACLIPAFGLPTDNPNPTGATPREAPDAFLPRGSVNGAAPPFESAARAQYPTTGWHEIKTAARTATFQ